MCLPSAVDLPTAVDKSVPVEEGTSSSSTMAKASVNNNKYKILAFVLGLTTIAFLISTTVLATKQNKNKDSPSNTNALAATATTGVDFFLESKASSSFFDTEEDNVCAGAKLAFENQLCVDLEVVPPQAGANVTMGYIGNLDVNGTLPNTNPYWKSGMCPVNVHW